MTNGETGFLAYETRFWFPSEQSLSHSPFYYSYEARASLPLPAYLGSTLCLLGQHSHNLLACLFNLYWRDSCCLHNLIQATAHLSVQHEPSLAHACNTRRR